MNLYQLQRNLYRANRLAGDVRAARRGTLTRRLVKRGERRLIFGWLRRIGL